jgi:hypothetical protein
LARSARPLLWTSFGAFSPLITAVTDRRSLIYEFFFPFEHELMIACGTSAGKNARVLFYSLSSFFFKKQKGFTPYWNLLIKRTALVTKSLMKHRKLKKGRLHKGLEP